MGPLCVTGLMLFLQAAQDIEPSWAVWMKTL